MIRVTCPYTIFGPLTKDFDTMEEALSYISLCLRHDLDVEVTLLD